MKSILFTFLVLLLSVQISSAQWVNTSTGMGNVNVISFTNNGNNIFAGVAAGGGVYLSTNNGTSWTQILTSQNVHSLASIGNNIFAGTNNGVYLSTNNGTSWTQTSLNNRQVLSLAVNGNNIFGGTGSNNGVYLSTDNGTVWTQTSLNNRTVRALAVNGIYIFAGSDLNGVYVSTDNGTTWTQTSLNNRYVRALAANVNYIFAGTDTNGVYVSTNNGATWTQTSLNNQTLRGLLANGNNIFAGTDTSGVFVSNNNGTTWTQRNEGLNSYQVGRFLILNNYIFAGLANGSINGVYRRPLGEVIGIQPISEQVPAHYALEQNYPNPFNPTTKFKIQISKLSDTRVTVYDVLGREVEILVNQQLKPGTYEVEWDASNYPTGMYLYKLTAEDYTETKKMVVIK